MYLLVEILAETTRRTPRCAVVDRRVKRGTILAPRAETNRLYFFNYNQFEPKSSRFEYSMTADQSSFGVKRNDGTSPRKFGDCGMCAHHQHRFWSLNSTWREHSRYQQRHRIQHEKQFYFKNKRHRIARTDSNGHRRFLEWSTSVAISA